MPSFYSSVTIEEICQGQNCRKNGFLSEAKCQTNIFFAAAFSNKTIPNPLYFFRLKTNGLKNRKKSLLKTEELRLFDFIYFRFAKLASSLKITL